MNTIDISWIILSCTFENLMVNLINGKFHGKFDAEWIFVQFTLILATPVGSTTKTLCFSGKFHDAYAI